MALDEGIDAETIRAVSTDDIGSFGPTHAALVEYVRRYVEGTVDDATHDRLAEHYDSDVLVSIALLSGCYLGLARVLDAFDVETEVPFVGWEPENL